MHMETQTNIDNFELLYYSCSVIFFNIQPHHTHNRPSMVLFFPIIYVLKHKYTSVVLYCYFTKIF